MFTDINEEARAAAFKIHYFKAIEVIDNDGFYWFSSTRPVADALKGLIAEAGIQTLYSELPPAYEFVLYKEHLFNREKLRRLSFIRYELKEQGVCVELLPTIITD